MTTSFITQGLERIATAAMRGQAAEVIYLDAAGHSTREIAKKVGVKVPEVAILRQVAGDGLIAAMRDDGYADAEIIRTLGVPTHRVLLEPVAA
jgi:hypothetical protein